MAFSGQMVACTVVGMGPENVALYRLNIRRQQSPMHTHGHSHGHCHGGHGHGPTQSTGTGQLGAGSAPMAAGTAADGGRQLSPGRSRVARAGPTDEAAMGEDSPAEGAASKGAALRKLALGVGRTRWVGGAASGRQAWPWEDRESTPMWVFSERGADVADGQFQPNLTCTRELWPIPGHSRCGEDVCTGALYIAWEGSCP